jgi:ParB family chromosome partitioning protein
MKIDFKTPPASASSNALADMLGVKKDIQQIDINKLIPYPNQPFRPYSDEKLQELAEDIAANGIISPIIVRPLDCEEYQILAGHNRVGAAKLAGFSAVPCIIKQNLDDTAAELILVNTNLNQRQELLPSEKAFAYKIQVSAIKKQSGTNCPNISEIAKDNQTNRKEIYRYIRLTYLNRQLLDLVDDGTIPFMAGVYLSYLSEQEQQVVLEYITENNIKISLERAEQIKACCPIDTHMLDKIFSKPEKSESNASFKAFAKRTKAVIPDWATEQDIEDVVKLIDSFFKERRSNG